MTLPLDLNGAVMDGVLTAVESALLGVGAERMWIDRHDGALAVLAELPAHMSVGGPDPLLHLATS